MTASASGPETAPPGHAPVSVSVAGHELTVFVETLPFITSLILDIRAARRRVWVETYMILADDVGQAVAEVLKERARAGLDVRLLYDAIGSQAAPWAFFADLQAAGVQVHCFHSLGEALWRFSVLRVLNRRNHRKLIVLDDRIGYFGGMNLVDAASVRNVGQVESLSFSSGWRDVHVRLDGPQQAELAESFERSWQQAHGEKVPARPAAYRKALLAEGEESIQFFDSGPGRRHTRVSRLFTGLIHAARRRLLVSMAYFLPVGTVLKALLKAPRRKVVVQIVVPGASDVPLVQYATRHLYTQLLRRRIRVFERQLNMLHSKVLVVDDVCAVVGSANMDARSLWINREFVAVIRSRKLARVLTDIVRYELDRSQRITLADFPETSWWRRLRNWLAWQLRWWL
jgi:cardiolipin synthase